MTSLAIITGPEWRLFYAVIGSRLYVSANSGYRWYEDNHAGLPEGIRFYAVALDSHQPDTCYAATDQGIFRRQLKKPWEPVSPQRVNVLAIDPSHSNVLWAAAGETVLRSTDGGATWVQASQGLDSWRSSGVTPSRTWVSDLVVDAKNPAILWAVLRLETSEQPPLGLLYRRGPSGRWEPVSLGPFEPAPGNRDSCVLSGIAFDPAANLLIAGCDRCWFNRGRLLLIHSPNADSAPANAVAWEAAARVNPPTSSCDAPGSLRPLLVDSQQPRTLFIGAAIAECGPFTGSRLLVSNNEGLSWQARRLVGVPQ